jgi:hypothetical protein
MISRLTNTELNDKIKTLAQKEREALREVLEHIKEADTRSLYLDFAFPNMFDYLVKGCGFSEGAAQRRIDAARLIKIAPQLADKIESGEINLGQVSIVQKAIRQKDKTAKVTLDEKKQLIAKLANKTSVETQKLVAQELDLEIKESPKETHQKNESVRLEVTFTAEQWAVITRARELAANATHSNDWSELFVYLGKKEIRQKEGSAATVAVKKQVLQRDQSCRYRESKSGRLCGSRWNLHVDHIQPRWAGGSDDQENLQILCQKHNHHRYREQAGLKVGI